MNGIQWKEFVVDFFRRFIFGTGCLSRHFDRLAKGMLLRHTHTLSPAFTTFVYYCESHIVASVRFGFGLFKQCASRFVFILIFYRG